MALTELHFVILSEAKDLAQRQRRFFAALRMTVLAASAIIVAGCQQKMADQPSYKPLEPSEFFVDGRSARPVVVGTVARGHLRIDTEFFTGRVEGRQAVGA